MGQIVAISRTTFEWLLCKHAEWCYGKTLYFMSLYYVSLGYVLLC
jgi:hypothetical protein